ncbi:uncharacterized protein VTP21DRAFT_6972 [Calcarisporiella thermophila]|uniref:uncharacterized protein n=1 Tax=Calcarisporiella thermophila TaxID=911321 RepID=UPI003743514B
MEIIKPQSPQRISLPPISTLFGYSRPPASALLTIDSFQHRHATAPHSSASHTPPPLHLEPLSRGPSTPAAAAAAAATASPHSTQKLTMGNRISRKTPGNGYFVWRCAPVKTCSVQASDFDKRKEAGRGRTNSTAAQKQRPSKGLQVPHTSRFRVIKDTKRSTYKAAKLENVRAWILEERT